MSASRVGGVRKVEIRVGVEIGIDDIRFVEVVGVFTWRDEEAVVLPRLFEFGKNLLVGVVGIEPVVSESTLGRVAASGEVHTDETSVGGVTQTLEQHHGGTFGHTSVAIGDHGLLGTIPIGAASLGIVNDIVGTTGVTIAENHGVENLDAVLGTKHGQDLMKSEDGLLQRRATEREHGVSDRLRERAAVTIAVGFVQREREQIAAVRDELTIVTRRGEEVKHVKRLEQVADVAIGVVVGIELLGTFGVVAVLEPNTIGESVEIERNVGATTEHGERDRLLDSGKQIVLHRTRPVENDHEPVVLATVDDSVLGEDILGPLVVDHLDRVETPGLGDVGATMFVRSLTHLELLDEIVHGRLLVVHELVTQGVLRRERVPMIGEHTSIHLAVVIAIPRRHHHVVDRIGRHDDAIHVHARQINDPGLVCVVPRSLRLGVVERSLRGRFEHTLAGVATSGSVRTVLLLTIGGTVGLLITIIITVATSGDNQVRLGVGHLLLLFESVLIQITRDIDDILPRLSVGKTIDERSLGVVEHRNVEDAEDAQLEVQIETIQNAHLRHTALIGDLEDVHVVQLLVAGGEVTLESGILRLDETLDAGVFDDVDHGHGVARIVGVDVHGCLEMESIVRNGRVGEQGVCDLVSDEHVVQARRHVLPLRQREDAVHHVERSSMGTVKMPHTDVLGGKETSERGDRVVVVGVVHACIIADPQGGATPLFDIRGRFPKSLWLWDLRLIVPITGDLGDFFGLFLPNTGQRACIGTWMW